MAGKLGDPHTMLARSAIQSYITSGEVVGAEELMTEGLTGKRAGCFVSIKRRGGELRGCIGTLTPTQANLAMEIIGNAIQAATADPRFPPVDEEELAQLSYSVDILEPMEKIDGMDKLDPSVYGVIVEFGWRTGVLLPMIEGVGTAEQQVEIARRKAGISPDAKVTLYRFRVERYQEL